MLSVSQCVVERSQQCHVESPQQGFADEEMKTQRRMWLRIAQLVKDRAWFQLQTYLIPESLISSCTLLLLVGRLLRTERESLAMGFYFCLTGVFFLINIILFFGFLSIVLVPHVAHTKGSKIESM